MNRFTLSNAALLMSYRVTPKEVEKIVDRLDIVPAQDVEIADAQEVRVAAVQLLLRRYASLSEYIVDMNSYVSDAVNRRAKLVCFPAYTGLLPASFLPQFDNAREAARPTEERDRPDAEVVGDYLSYFSDCIFDAYFNAMSSLAARHRVYIMAGSTIYFDQNVLRHRALLFDNRGDLAGYQDKLSLSPFEQELGMDPANELKVFESPVGPVAILTGSDADYFEIARAARSLGAKVLLGPTALRGEFTPVRATLGLNMRVQETRLWGAQSVLVGDTGLGFAAEGAACIYAPVELTYTKNGILSQSNGKYEPDAACDTLHLNWLSRGRSSYKSDVNIEFMEKYIDRIY